MERSIVAVATARGAGGIAILRVSGPLAEEILGRVFCPVRRTEPIVSHRLMYGHAVGADGEVLDEVMAVLMRGPYSYTREDVVEIQCHGGDMAARRILARILECGAVPAEPGEFTKRAFLNGRIDLSRAEAVMQIVGATSEAAVRASVRQLEGGVTGFVRSLSERILGALAHIEACTDFPDEVEEEITAAQVCHEIQEIIAEMSRRCDPRGARLIREGASIVLAGRPNVGKSSLMNALLNQERAIVTAVPGTTRDVLTERITIGGISAEISDTAGRRDTDDLVERIGVDRARRAVETADIVLVVIDASQSLDTEDVQLLRDADERSIICLNKADLPPIVTPEQIAEYTSAELIELSAAEGLGVPDLLERLNALLSSNLAPDALTVERHVNQVMEARKALERALAAVSAHFPLDTLAIDLKHALSALSQITSIDPTDALLTEIFSTFCVGK